MYQCREVSHDLDEKPSNPYALSVRKACAVAFLHAQRMQAHACVLKDAGAARCLENLAVHTRLLRGVGISQALPRKISTGRAILPPALPTDQRVARLDSQRQSVGL